MIFEIMNRMDKKTLGALSIVAVTSMFTVGCTVPVRLPLNMLKSADQEKQQINSDAEKELEHLYRLSPKVRELVSKAKGVLVFPRVFSAGVMVGGEYGRGVLRVSGVPQAYYRVLADTVGLHAEAQTKTEIILFMTNKKLQQFKESHEWTVGTNVSMAILKEGVYQKYNDKRNNDSVIGFVITNAEVSAGASLAGQKISGINI